MKQAIITEHEPGYTACVFLHHADSIPEMFICCHLIDWRIVLSCKWLFSAWFSQEEFLTCTFYFYWSSIPGLHDFQTSCTYLLHGFRTTMRTVECSSCQPRLQYTIIVYYYIIIVYSSCILTIWCTHKGAPQANTEKSTHCVWHCT